jgi:hypothetical protein
VVEHCDSARFAPEPAHYCLENPFVATCVNGTCANAGEPTYECADDVTTACGYGRQIEVRCAPLGLICAHGITCGPDEDTVIDCDTIGESSCQGSNPDVVQVCGGLVATTYRCQDLEGTCATNGKPRCALPTDVCSPVDPGMNECEGSKLTACVAGQRIVFDCASVGLDCLPKSGDKSGRCGSP